MAFEVIRTITPTLPAHIQYGRKLDADIHVNLSHSCAQALTLNQLFEGDQAYFNQLLNRPLEYASIQGSVSLRSAIADFHQTYNGHDCVLSADNVVTFAGAQEGLAAIYQAILKPGDEVIVFTPSYPSLINMVEQCGATIRAIPLLYDGDWQYDLPSLKACINNNTKLIVINAPHNPTGAILSQTQLDDILSLAQGFNCYLISDDVTQPLVHENEVATQASDAITLAHNLLNYEKTILVSVMSKSFGLAGIRLGWVVSNDHLLLEKLIAIKAYGSICTSLFDEWVAEFALSRAAELIEKNIAIIRKNRIAMKRFVIEHNGTFTWSAPSAGVLSLLKIKIQTPVEPWLAKLAKEENVLLLPSRLFGLEGSFVRLGLGQENFTDGLASLSNFCKKTL